MIEPRQALYAHLLADSGVMEAVKVIYQGRAPAGAEKPLLLIQPLISRVPRRDLGGVAYKQARIQVTAMAKTQKEVEKAIKAVIDAVEGHVGMMAGELQVILVEIDNDRQVAQDAIEEIYHHVDVMVIYKG